MKIEKHLFIVHTITCTIGAFLAYALFEGVLDRLTKAFPGYPDLTVLSPGTPPGFIISIHQMGPIAVLVLSALFIGISAFFTFKKSDKSKLFISVSAVLNILYLVLIYFSHIRSLLGITL